MVKLCSLIHIIWQAYKYLAEQKYVKRIYNHRQDYDELQTGKMNIKMPDTEIKPKGGRIIE